MKTELDLKLNLYGFDIPSIEVGRAITHETLVGADKSLRRLREIVTSASASGLVGADGKPLVSASMETPLERMHAWMTEMLERPTLRHSYSVSATTGGLNAFDSTSSNLAVVIYTQICQIMAEHIGPQVMEALASQIDAILLLFIQNLERGCNPRILLEQTLRLTVADPKTGTPLIGSAQERGIRFAVLSILLGFLVIQGAVTTTIPPDKLEASLAVDADTGDLITVTPRGHMLLEHLTDALAIKLSLRKALTELTQDSPLETKTASDIEADFKENTNHV